MSMTPRTMTLQHPSAAAPVLAPVLAAVAGTDERNAQKLDNLRRRHRALKEIEQRNKGNADRIAQELDLARAEAEQAFGTSDIDVLRTMYEEIKAQNAAAMADFEANIVQAEGNMDALEHAVAALERAAGML